MNWLRFTVFSKPSGGGPERKHFVLVRDQTQHTGRPRRLEVLEKGLQAALKIAGRGRYVTRYTTTIKK